MRTLIKTLSAYIKYIDLHVVIGTRLASLIYFCTRSLLFAWKHISGTEFAQSQLLVAIPEVHVMNECSLNKTHVYLVEPAVDILLDLSSPEPKTEARLEDGNQTDSPTRAKQSKVHL